MSRPPLSRDRVVDAASRVADASGLAGVSMRSVGRELDVRYILEGSVQRSGDTLRVSAQLVDAGSGFHVWAHKYDRPVKELFALQDEIAAKIAGALRLVLRPSGGGASPAPDAPAPTPVQT